MMPIMLDVGTDNKERCEDPVYLGLSENRMRGRGTRVFIDGFVEALCKFFPHALLQWEDLLKENAISQLNRFKDKLCSFKDDIWGTEGIVLEFIAFQLFLFAIGSVFW